MSRRSSAAPVDAGRPLALRSVRLRMDLARVQANGATSADESRRAEERRSARPLRRGLRADPPRPDRRLARQLSRRGGDHPAPDFGEVTRSAKAAPTICASTNAGTPAGSMPENVAVNPRASVTAGFAN